MNFVKVALYLILSFCFFSSNKTHAQTAPPKSYKLFVNLEKAPFDSVYLHDYTEGRDILIAGKQTQKFTWEIIIPDSIVWDSEDMELLASPYDSKSNALQSIRFITNNSGKKTIIVNVGVEDENNYIYGTYVDTAQFPEQHIIERIGSKHSINTGDLICQDFRLTIKDNNSDIAIRALEPFFSWFDDLSIGSYDDQLKFYIELSKTYPGSRYLMTNLATNLNQYKSKTDVKKVYENFSKKHKNTIWAKNIERFLNDKKIPNTSLSTVNKNTDEYIVQDSSKYNLIIFSASWCGPCIEEIPLLKKIYKDLGKKLILTYVSIDNEKGIIAFQKLMQDKEVPWRALFAYKDIKAIKQKYFIEDIPHTILIHPNQDMEIIDVRKPDDLSKLYGIIGSLGKQKN